MMKRYLYPLLRVALGAIFVYASFHKILRPDQFADGINNYHILPVFLVNLVALTLPWIELMFGMFLIFNFKAPAASLAVTIMMVVFIIAMISAWMRGIDTGCVCFSNEGEAISIKEVVRDSGFLIMSLFVFAGSIRNGSKENSQAETL